MSVTTSTATVDNRAALLDQTTSASPFLKNLNLEHGPLDVLGRFFLKADQAVRNRGVELSLTTIDELADFNRRHLKDSPLMPVFNPRMTGLAGRPSFAILGRDQGGRIVATQAARLYEWPDTCLTEEAQNLKMFYGDAPPPDGTACQVTAPAGRQISGRVIYSGAGWYEPEYRKRELSYILPRLSRALALTQWNSDFTISFVEWVKDDHVLLEKVPGFTLKSGNYDEIEWKVIPEASTRSAELIAGNVDIITNVPPDQHQAINDSGAAGIEGVAGTRRMYVGYNLGPEFADTADGKIIQDPKVRVALQYAVDVPTICKTLLSFECERASSMVNPPNNNTNLTPYPFDPAMAEKLLDEAGYPRGADGTRFEMGMMAGKGRYLNDVNVVLAIAQYLTDIGVKVNLQQMEWGSEFVPLLREHKVGPLFFVGTGGATWSAQYDMSDISTPDASTNYTGWSNPDWFAGWTELEQTRDPAAEKAITDKMQEVMYNDPPWLFLYFQPDFYGVASDVDWQPRRDEIVDATTAKPK